MKKMFKSCETSLLFIIGLLANQYIGGTPLLCVLILWWCLRIYTYTERIETLFKTISLNAYLNSNGTLYNFLLKRKIFIKIISIIYTLGSISFFLYFFLSSLAIKIFLILDVFIVYYLFIKSNKKSNFIDKEFNTAVSKLIKTLFVVVINIIILLGAHIFFTTIEEFSPLPSFKRGVPDPSITQWVKNNVHHSSIWAQMVIRSVKYFSITLKNIFYEFKVIYFVINVMGILSISLTSLSGISIFYFKEIELSIIKIEKEGNYDK